MSTANIVRIYWNVLCLMHISTQRRKCVVYPCLFVTPPNLITQNCRILEISIRYNKNDVTSIVLKISKLLKNILMEVYYITTLHLLVVVMWKDFFNIQRYFVF